MIKLNKVIGTQSALSTAYHPQTDGQTERTNQEIEQYLRVYISLAQDDWVEWLASGEFAYNNWEHTSTKQSPFFLEYGRHPITPAKPKASTQNPSADEFIKNLETAREAARRALEDTAERMKKYADRKRSEEKEFQIGDKVWLDAEHLNTGRPSKTLDN
jgi:hypothetical protein